MKETNFNEYKKILEAKEVTIHNLLQYFGKEMLDYDEFGNIYVNFKKGSEKLPILVAHTDNVLGDGERTPVYSIDKKRIFDAEGTGIGFDDKAGIIAIIEIWKSIPNAKDKFRIIFPAEEEIGGVGSNKIPAERYNKARYIIEIDRKNGKDLIRHSGGTKLCSKAFAGLWSEYGYKEADGIFTDVNQFKPKAKKVQMMNISIGYYNPHTKNEYLEISEFEHTKESIADFIEKHHGEEFVDDEPEDTYDYKKYNYGNYGSYDKFYDRFDELDEDVEGECEWCGEKGKLHWDEETQMYICEDCMSYCQTNKGK